MLGPIGFGLLRQGGLPSREDAPEGLGHPALREPDLGGDLALAPALEYQFQDAFIATHPRDGGFVALLAAACGGTPGRGAAAGHRARRRRRRTKRSSRRPRRW